MNRIIIGIEKAKAVIAQNGLSPEKLAEASKKMDLELREYCDFQELKSVASQTGVLTLDEATTVYGYLGNTPEHYNNQPIHVKWVLMELLVQLAAPFQNRNLARN